MRILAIETSCDETGIAIVEGVNLPDTAGTGGGFAFTVLSSALISQAALHAPYGGVYPNLAKREHEKNLPIILEEALKRAEPKLSEKIVWGLPEDFFSESFGAAVKENIHIDAIAVTQGPGLEPALWTGIEFAKKLAEAWQLPLLPTNHMEGHLLSSLIKNGELKEVQLPVLGLLISGGHTEFVLMREWFEYQIIGQTLDDALGEAFDKVARMLALPYPGGPEISRLAEMARAEQKLVSEKVLGSASPQPDHFSQQVSAPLKLPRPMIGTKDCDVSFSGLKTAVLYALRDRGGIQSLSAEEIADFAREFEDAATDVLVHKTRRALEESGAQTFVIGGGVAANTHIRKSLEKLVKEKFNEVEIRLPEISITGDNAVMIAEAALIRALSGKQDATTDEIRAKGNLSISAVK